MGNDTSTNTTMGNDTSTNTTMGSDTSTNTTMGNDTSTDNSTRRKRDVPEEPPVKLDSTPDERAQTAQHKTTMETLKDKLRRLRANLLNIRNRIWKKW